MKKIIPDDNARGRLFYAFLELIEKKPYDKIKVRELIEKANVNRSTFYRYYSDIFDYYDRICSSGLYYAFSSAEKCVKGKSTEDGLKAFSEILKARITDFADIIRIITGPHGSISFLRSFNGYITEHFEAHLNPKTEEEEFLIGEYSAMLTVCLFCSALPSDDMTRDYVNGYEYAADKGLFENILNTCTAGRSPVFKTLANSAAHMFLTKEPKSFNVNSITKYAGINRTEFYNYFGNTQKMIQRGAYAASYVCARILFAVSVCDEKDFVNKIPKNDINTIADTEMATERARQQRAYYSFVKNIFCILRDMLCEHFEKKGVAPTPEQEEALNLYVAWAAASFVAFSEENQNEELKKRILWGKERLIKSGLSL